MAFDITNRETIRDEVATLLETGLVGSGKPVQAVYNYTPSDFDGKSPVVCVASAGDSFQRWTFGEKFKGDLFLDVLIFVLYSDPASGWTEANAEDQLDLVKKEFLDTLFDNQFTSARQIYIDSRSTVEPVTVGGDPYLMERVPLRVQMMDD